MTEETFFFIDTETTGFPKKDAKVQDGQARVCQVAMLLTDSIGNPLAKFCSLIKPDGWTISEGAQKVHGFTNEKCEKYGLNVKAVIALYVRMAQLSTMRIAHNAEFDKTMMDIELAYSPYVDADAPYFCTMKTNTHITGGKWPKLEEALQHFCQRSLGDTAHDALIDVEACKDIFFAMRKKQEAA